MVGLLRRVSQDVLPSIRGGPEWAPPGENHILYSDAVLKDVSYAPKMVQYTSTQSAGTEYLRLAFRPTRIILAGVRLSLRSDLDAQGYTLEDSEKKIMLSMSEGRRAVR